MSNIRLTHCRLTAARLPRKNVSYSQNVKRQAKGYAKEIGNEFVQRHR